ncbi:hypothetical protein QSI_3914 [Clostridioides difficile P28]|nr:hypothetical protein QSI_3914 [Clostridioides difficile P28]
MNLYINHKGGVRMKKALIAYFSAGGSKLHWYSQCNQAFQTSSITELQF